MPYTVVDDDTTLEVRASIEYRRPDELVTLIETLQRRLTKMEIAREPGSTEPVQSVSPVTRLERNSTAGVDDSNQAGKKDK